MRVGCDWDLWWLGGEADPYGMTDRKAKTTATAKVKARTFFRCCG
jgi:hypothetical protein